MPVLRLQRLLEPDRLTPEALRDRILDTLAVRRLTDPAVERLATLLSAPRAVERYLDVYRYAIRG